MQISTDFLNQPEEMKDVLGHPSESSHQLDEACMKKYFTSGPKDGTHHLQCDFLKKLWNIHTDKNEPLFEHDNDEHSMKGHIVACDSDGNVLYKNETISDQM